MLNRLTSQQLTEWMAFYNLEPWGSATEDARALATVAGYRAKKFQAGDFLRSCKPEPQTPDDMLRQLESAMAGGRNGT